MFIEIQRRYRTGRSRSWNKNVIFTVLMICKNTFRTPIYQIPLKNPLISGFQDEIY
jgi:hypothetical protein